MTDETGTTGLENTAEIEASEVDVLVMPWPWDQFPEDLSTWEQCKKEHIETKKVFESIVAGKWVEIAYARLGRCRANMDDEQIRTVQLFLGPLEA